MLLHLRTEENLKKKYLLTLLLITKPRVYQFLLFMVFTQGAKNLFPKKCVKLIFRISEVSFSFQCLENSF